MSRRIQMEEIEEILANEELFAIPEVRAGNKINWSKIKIVDIYRNLLKKVIRVFDTTQLQQQLDHDIKAVGPIYGHVVGSSEMVQAGTYRAYVKAINNIKNQLQTILYNSKAPAQLSEEAAEYLQPKETFFLSGVNQARIKYIKAFDNFDKLDNKEKADLFEACKSFLLNLYRVATLRRPLISKMYQISSFEFKLMNIDEFLSQLNNFEKKLVDTTYNEYKTEFVKKYVATHLKNRVERLKRGEVFSPPSAPTEQGVAAAGGGGGGRQPVYFQGVELLMPNQNDGAAAAGGGGGGAALQQGGRKTKKQRKSSHRKTRRRN